MYSSHSWLAAPSPMTRGSSLPFPNPDPSAPHDPPPPLAGVRPPARGWMDPPFVFPSSLRDLERDTDGDDEPSLRPQDTVAVAALRAADLEEFVKGNVPPPTSLPQSPTLSISVGGCPSP